MAFCPNCGKPISENAEFCGNCGNKVNKDTNTKNVGTIKNFDFKKVLLAIKEYFLHFYVDYNSKIFKFAMILFMSIGFGESIYDLISVTKILPTKAYTLFPDASIVYRFLMCAILFGVFSILILKSKDKTAIKKSNFLMIAWIVATVLNFLVFLAGINLYEYILFSNYASVIAELLIVAFTAALVFKNRPKYPFVLIISALSFALRECSSFSIKLNISLYKIWPTGENLGSILQSLSYILLVLILFLLVYIIPRKISKWLVYVPTLVVVVSKFIQMLDYFSFIDIIDFALDICIVVMFVLLALSCSKKVEYNYIIENNEKRKNSAVKLSVISISAIITIVIPCLLISAIVSSNHINDGIKKWKSQIVYGSVNDELQWNTISRDIFGQKATKFASQFIEEYSFYQTLKENRTDMKRISICYSAYRNETVDNDIIEEYSYISIDDSWENDSVLSAYYDKYVEMQPNAKKVSFSKYIDVDDGKIKVTVKNENVMPISKCTIECKFTIIFVESGYYSSSEYGRGTKTIEVEDIEGNSEKTVTVSFNPDDYYDGYGSYIIASLMDSSAEIILIE